MFNRLNDWTDKSAIYSYGSNHHSDKKTKGDC